MLNLETKGIINSRYVTWIGKYHKDWIVKKFSITESVNDDDDELDDLKIQKDNQESNKSRTRIKRCCYK